MCKVDESKNCMRAIIFYDQDKNKVELPIPGTAYYEKEDIASVVQSRGYDLATISDPVVVMKKEQDTVYISDHAMCRLRKRLGFNRSAAYRMTKKAWEEGITRDRANGYLRTWIDKKIENNPEDGSDYRIYGQYAFIYNKNVLVTVYNMVQKESYKVTHERIRDKKYNRSRENHKMRKAIQNAQYM